MKYFWALTAASIVTNVALVQQVASAKSAEEVGSIATAITVEMKSDKNIGSGILLQHQGDVYTVLTAYHVVKGNKSMTIKTADGTVHTMLANSMQHAGNNLDLAVVKFRASQSYTLAKIGISNTLKAGSVVYVAGFPDATLAVEAGLFNFTEGKVIGKANKGNSTGYSLIYSNITRGGMSGGPVLNHAGELVAIHGQGDRKGDKGDGDKTGRNLGIVVERFGTAAVAMGVKLDQQVAALPPSQTVNAADYYLIGVEKGSEGDYQGALASFNKAIALNPKYSSSYVYRGAVHMYLNNPNAALADLNKAIAIDPRSAEAYSNRGILKTDKLNDPNGALADYNRAIALDPKYAKAYVNRGILKDNKLNDKSGGLADINQAIALDPKLAEAYVIRSYADSDRASNIRDLKKAAQLFRKQGRVKYLQIVLEELRKKGATE